MSLKAAAILDGDSGRHFPAGNFKVIISSFLKIHIKFNKLKEEGAEGIILGCTELSILIKQSDVTIPLFDTTLIHATSAVKFALGNGQ